MKKKKGFTLIELIIVIAIIGILAAVLIPTWNHMIAKARIKSQNNNAKVVFDAAQKECIDLKRRDRTLRNDMKRQQEIISNPPTPAAREQAEAALNAAKASQYITSDFYFYFDGKKGYACDENCNDISANAEMNKEFTDAVKRNIATSNDELVYKIHVVDYNVVSVATARFDTDSAMGSYPVLRTKRTENGVKNFNLSKAEKTYETE